MKAGLARGALRAASGSARCVARNAVRTVLRPAATVSACSSVVVVDLASRPSLASRAFSTSASVCKKKSKSAIAQDNAEFLAGDADFLAAEEDDLFGGTSSEQSVSGASSSSSSSAATRGVRVAAGPEFDHAVVAWEASLSWESIDLGQPPSLHKWRELAGRASTKEDFAALLRLAQLYRDRVGSLGLKSGARLASRAAAVGYPELGLNAFLDRYKYGLEADLQSLYLLQRSLRQKALCASREDVLESQTLDGAPVQQIDMLSPLNPDAPDAAAAENNGEVEEFDAELARARLSIIDRMALLVLLSPPLNQGVMDPVLLSFLPATYVRAFKLWRTDVASQPHFERIVRKTDDLVALLTSSAYTALQKGIVANYYEPNHPNSDARRGHGVLVDNLTATLSYVARKGDAHAKLTGHLNLDPVMTLYRYIETYGAKPATSVVQKIEPLLQGRTAD
ncbi:hypothetical protein ACQY0O_006394 [Thecaphora frezii]